jgi:hypothetical protein
MLIPLTTVEYAQHLFQRYNDIPHLVLSLVLIRDAIALFGMPPRDMRLRHLIGRQNDGSPKRLPVRGLLLNRISYHTFNMKWVGFR